MHVKMISRGDIYQKRRLSDKLVKSFEAAKTPAVKLCAREGSQAL